MSIVFYVFFILVIVEVGLFAAVGGLIGALPTILLTVLTTAVGLFLLRRQSLSALQRFRTDLNGDSLREDEVFDGACLAIGAIFLLSPGFFTDFVGILVFLPAFRKRLIRQVSKGFARTAGPAAGKIIDGEFENITEPNSEIPISKVEQDKNT